MQVSLKFDENNLHFRRRPTYVYGNVSLNSSWNEKAEKASERVVDRIETRSLLLIQFLPENRAV